MPPPPLSEGNRLQRAYARWAAPHYARLPPEAREPAELLDRILYSRRGVGLWLGLAAAFAGTLLGLRHAGFGGLEAALLAAVLWIGLPVSLLGAWLAPGRYSTSSLWRRLPLWGLLAMAGGLLGFAVARMQRQGVMPLQQLAADLWANVAILLPAVLAGGATMTFMLWAVAAARRQALERALERERLAHERDAAALAASRARLQLLQAQIQPHFVFNTLAALQHWVDIGDARAPALLRQLTAFLRGSTELLGREHATLGEEAEVASQYLHIMQARLGERLRWHIDIAPETAATALPPGLLLTLVENAVEHGLAPTLAGGTLQVQARREGDQVQVRVTDDGAGLGTAWQEGTGLANCRARLQHFGDGQGRITLHALEQGTQAVLSLPGGPATAGAPPAPARDALAQDTAA